MSSSNPVQAIRALIFAASVAFVAAHPSPSGSMSSQPSLLQARDYNGPGAQAPVRPFSLSSVSLGTGLMSSKRDLIKDFIAKYDERRFLILFNNQAGRPNPPGISVPGGWEDGGLLSGHWTGHYMSALSQAYADSGEEVYRQKLDWMVTELAECQKAITARMSTNSTSSSSLQEPQTQPQPRAAADSDSSWIPTHPNYLGALSESTVLRLGPPLWAVYGSNLSTNTWAPWYTQHKIMRGLLDAYYNTNNTLALSTVVKMADWAHLALTLGDIHQPGYKGNLTRDDWNYMWDLYIAGEYGGVNEVFPEIWALTGKKEDKYLDVAKIFDNRESLFDAAVQDRDILVVKTGEVPGRRRRERLHANTHVPQFIGYMRVYEYTGEQEYLDAAKNFYKWVVEERMFASGGAGGDYPGVQGGDNSELFQNRGNIANAMGHDGAETCTTYNILKLARDLFLHEQEEREDGGAGYMDTYERGLFNMILGSRADKAGDGGDGDGPLVTYFQPLTPGKARDFGNTGTCCGGTGMESHTKYQDTVYLRSEDGGRLWVNLYVPSTLRWEEKGIEVKQETEFPRRETTKLTIATSGGEQKLDIKLRVPGWMTSGDDFAVTVNGDPVSASGVKPSSYLTISRAWKTGDEIDIRLPFQLRMERAIDRPDTQALFWGPLLLQTLGTPPNTTDDAGPHFWQISLYQYLKLDGDYSKFAIVRTDDTSGHDDPLFKTRSSSGTDLDIRPYYISTTDPVSSYFRRHEPTVIFGTIQTNIENRKRNDGLPAYEIPVTGYPVLPERGSDGLTFLDVVWDQAPFKSHDEFVKIVKTAVVEFVGKDVYSEEEGDVIVQKAKEAEKELAPE